MQFFLRVLENYEGIMFLTTNRIGTFDEAFRPRIHLAMKYPPLTHNYRRDLWKIFITNGSTLPPPAWIDDSVLDKLASQAINGRQVKNVVRTAYTLAANAGGEFILKHLVVGIKAIMTFESEFGNNFSSGEGRNGDCNSNPERAAKRQRTDKT